MDSTSPQSYASHVRLDPMFHFVLLPLEAIAFGLAIWNLIRNPGAVALRFASDAEAPALVEKSLANRWKPKEIKQAIRQWRPDYFRV